MKKLGAVILTGGQSSRMGTPKSQLMLNGQSFLEILVSTFQSKQIPVVVVDAPGHESPLLKPETTWLVDQREGYGPLEGVRVGLEYLHDKTELAFVTACDSPLLKIEVVEYLVSLVDGYQAVIPESIKAIYGLTAVYRTDVHSIIGSRILAGEKRVQSLSQFLQAKMVSLETFRPLDPEMVSFLNVNSPDDYDKLIRSNPAP